MRRVLVLLTLSLGLLLVPALEPRASAAEPGVVLVVPIEGMVDLGMGPFVQRALEEAAELKALGVILDVNTLGGRVDAAVAIRDHLLRSTVPSVAFVNPRAISAGALIALAAEELVVSRGATIGAATPVMLGQPDQPAQPVEEKTVSYVRKEFRATADARQRPGLIAEAMVDADVEIEGVIAKGKLLTLTTDEALEHGVADYRADDLNMLLAEQGWAGAELRRLQMNWAEQVVRFLTHPVLASLLMTLGVLGLVIELRTPGFGIPGLVGLLSLALFFWGHALVQLVGWEQILLVSLGLLLLAAEVFLVPGFGVVGIAGIALLSYGLTTSLIGGGATLSAVLLALSRVAISAVLAVAASLLLLPLLPKLPGGRMLVLQEVLGGGASGREVSGEPERASLLGVAGVALTPLRPAGIAELSGRRVDVVSQGEFIEAAEPIEVVRDDGTRVVVRRPQRLVTQGDPK